MKPVQSLYKGPEKWSLKTDVSLQIIIILMFNLASGNGSKVLTETSRVHKLSYTSCINYPI